MIFLIPDEGKRCGSGQEYCVQLDEGSNGCPLCLFTVHDFNTYPPHLEPYTDELREIIKRLPE